jgi:hypothetical protein
MESIRKLLENNKTKQEKLEEKVDFLLRKQVQRDLEETLKSQEVDPGV